LTWNNAPVVSGSPLSTAGGTTSSSWVEYDVTAAITGNGTYRFALISPSPDELVMNSKEAANNRPELVIELVGGG
jgi:hypothetical protein